MDGTVKFIVVAILLCNIHLSFTELVCGEDKLLCGDGSKCILPSQLCDYTPDCEDLSDEMNLDLCKKLAAQKVVCRSTGPVSFNVKCSSSYAYLNNQCIDIVTACTLGDKCLGPKDNSICNEIADNTLKPTMVSKERSLQTKQEHPHDFYGMLEFISDALNETVKRNFTQCPPFFTPFKGKCFSFFVPAQVTWSEAKLFCESISGRLAMLDDIYKFKIALDYIKAKGIKSNFWIGGYLRDDVEETENSATNWSWLNRKPIEMGAPFWSLALSDPNSKALCPGVTKSLRPRSTNTGEMCLSILEENHYYFSDEDCNQRLSPVCLFK